MGVTEVQEAGDIYTLMGDSYCMQKPTQHCNTTIFQLKLNVFKCKDKFKKWK